MNDCLSSLSLASTATLLQSLRSAEPTESLRLQLDVMQATFEAHGSPDLFSSSPWQLPEIPQNVWADLPIRHQWATVLSSNSSGLQMAAASGDDSGPKQAPISELPAGKLRALFFSASRPLPVRIEAIRQYGRIAPTDGVDLAIETFFQFLKNPATPFGSIPENLDARRMQEASLLALEAAVALLPLLKLTGNEKLRREIFKFAVMLGSLEDTPQLMLIRNYKGAADIRRIGHDVLDEDRAVREIFGFMMIQLRGLITLDTSQAGDRRLGEAYEKALKNLHLREEESQKKLEQGDIVFFKRPPEPISPGSERMMRTLYYPSRIGTFLFLGLGVINHHADDFLISLLNSLCNYHCLQALRMNVMDATGALQPEFAEFYDSLSQRFEKVKEGLD